MTYRIFRTIHRSEYLAEVARVACRDVLVVLLLGSVVLLVWRDFTSSCNVVMCRGSVTTGHLVVWVALPIFGMLVARKADDWLVGASMTMLCISIYEVMWN